MNFICKAALTLLTLLASSLSQAADLITYDIDRGHSSVNFSVSHLGIIPVKGKFDKFEGTFQYNPKTNEIQNISIKIDADSIDTNQSDRDTHLKSTDFFGVRNDLGKLVKKRRYVTFTSNKKTNIKKSKGISGKLKLLDAQKNVTFKGGIKYVDKKIGGQLKLKINRHNYGLNWQGDDSSLAKSLAGKSVGDDVMIEVIILAKVKKNKKKKKK